MQLHFSPPYCPDHTHRKVWKDCPAITRDHTYPLIDRAMQNV